MHMSCRSSDASGQSDAGCQLLAHLVLMQDLTLSLRRADAQELQMLMPSSQPNARQQLLATLVSANSLGMLKKAQCLRAAGACDTTTGLREADCLL